MPTRAGRLSAPRWSCQDMFHGTSWCGGILLQALSGNTNGNGTYSQPCEECDTRWGLLHVHLHFPPWSAGLPQLLELVTVACGLCV